MNINSKTQRPKYIQSLVKTMVQVINLSSNVKQKIYMIWYKITCNCPVHLTNNPKSKSILKLVVYGYFLFLLFWRGVWHLFWFIFFWNKTIMWVMIRGHSTTTWTKFWPILTPSPLEWTSVDILQPPPLVHVDKRGTNAPPPRYQH